MRTLVLPMAVAAAMATPLSAQIVMRAPNVSVSRVPFAMDAPRAVIGVTTTSSATSRDTLGVLVSSVRSGSPAEKAGIEEGNRIAAVNGVSLKLAAADVGEEEIAGSMTRRLTRELDKLKPGDEVTLSIVSEGKTKTVKVKTISPDDLYQTRSVVRRDSDRATLGLDVAMTGNARDTIGVFVMSVEDGSPAAKAGIEEGSRIASINGVDVRGRRPTDDDDVVLRTTNVSRLERELAKVKPGDDVDLRVYYNGQFKNLKVKAARLSDMPRHNHSVFIMGGDNALPIMPPLPPSFDQMVINPEVIGDRVRRALDGVRTVTIPRLRNSVIW